MDNYIGYTIYSQIRDENLSLFFEIFDFFEKADAPKERSHPISVTLVAAV